MARKKDLREVDAVARESGVDRKDFGDYIHELKRGGQRGSKANGDFTMEELRHWAQYLKEERFRDDSDN